MARRRPEGFDPLATLAALERGYVEYVLIGRLAQVLRGADVVTAGVDICPSFSRGNLNRLDRAVRELDEAAAVELDEQALSTEPIVRVAARSGEIGIVAAPAGIPNGYVDLRRAASREDLGGGLRPLVASTGDLAAMAAALGRPEDADRLSMLRRMIELEADRTQTLSVRPTVVSRSARAQQAGQRITP